MDQISDFSDSRNKSWCVHCGGWVANLLTNRDHAPSKSLLRRPYPENLPCVEVCTPCNSGFSQDEEHFAALLGSVVIGSTDPILHDKDGSSQRILARSEMLRVRIEKSKQTYETLGGDTRVIWKPEWERVRRVIVKNARGHAYYEYGEPMPNDPSTVWATPLESMTATERDSFEDANSPLWPEVGSRMMTRVVTGQDLVDGWVSVQDQTYRYAVFHGEGLTVRTVLREYLATEVCWAT